MHWITDYWWIIIILLLIGIIWSAVKQMQKIDPKRFLDNKPKLPPHRDFNDKWDDGVCKIFCVNGSSVSW